MLKRIVCLLLTLVMLAAVFSGCSLSNDGYDINKLALATGKTPDEVIKILGEGTTQYNNDNSVGAIEYEGEVFGNKALVRPIFNGGVASEVSVYFSGEIDYKKLCKKLKSIFGDSVYESDSEKAKNRVYETPTVSIVATENDKVTKIMMYPITPEEKEQEDTTDKTTTDKTTDTAQQ